MEFKSEEGEKERPQILRLKTHHIPFTSFLDNINNSLQILLVCPDLFADTVLITKPIFKIISQS